jgi:four helix bundle protein
MKYSRFEELPVWQAAIEMKLDLDDLCRHAWVKRLRNWVDQIDRVSLSVSNNIAEGFERGTTNELLYFLYVARGSAGETRSLLRYLDRRLERAEQRDASAGSKDANLQSEISNLKSQISNLKSALVSLRKQIQPLIEQTESISRQLRGWADSLQNGDIAGQRHLTDGSRKDYLNRRGAEAFWQQIRSQHRARWASPGSPIDDHPQAESLPGS